MSPYYSWRKFEFPKVTKILSDRDRLQIQGAKHCLTMTLCETDVLGLILGDSDSFMVRWDGVREEPVNAGAASC